ncbi:MAG: hypothetical protein AAF458_04425 [Pseudomonadota bacterium]
MRVTRWFFLTVLLAAAASRAATVDTETAGSRAQLAPLEAAGTGVWAAVLTVPEVGFYSVQVRGGPGVEVRLRGRMTGPQRWHTAPEGAPGARIDSLLDAGSYVLDVRSPGGNQTQAPKATIARATERNAADAPWPAPGAGVSTTLADGELRSYWLTLRTDRVVTVQAAGRALTDVRVFRDGIWVMPDRRERVRSTPTAGAPLIQLSITLMLPAGRYRISAVGARPLAWTQDADQFPLHLRTGFVRVAANQRTRRTLSPFGADHFLVPQSANLARVEFAVPAEASLRVQAYAQQWPFKRAGELRELTRKQRIPMLEIRPRGRPGFASADDYRFDLVTVRGEPGTGYVLQTARASRRQSVTTPGFYRVQALPIGAARDHAPVTGLAFSGPRSQQRHGLAASGAVQLTPGSHFVRQFNLERATEFFVRVVADGRYRFSGSGAEAAYAIKPYGRPSKGKWREQSPDSDGTLELTRGYYRLYVRPDLPGVHQMTIGGAAADTTRQRALPTAVGYDAIEVKPEHEAIISNADAADAVGLSIRKLPIELAQPLPVLLDPGESVEIPVSVDVAGVLRFEAWDGGDGVTLMTVAENGQRGAEGRELAVVPGVTVTSVRSHRLAPLAGLLTFSPGAEPDMPAAPPPEYRRLPLNGPIQAHIKDGLGERFLVTVPRSGYYGLRSAGVLALRAALHTRARAGLVDAPSAAPGAAGRNFAWHGWLSAGDYHLDVTPQGSSRGLATLAFVHLPPAVGGSVTEDRSAAVSLASNDSASTSRPLWRFQVDVPVAGRYRLRAMEGDQRHPFTLMDPQGWPVTVPFASGEAVLDLDPGAHVLIVAPARRARRLVVELVPEPAAAVREGHGPHELTLPSVVTHRWHDDGPDLWTFELDAPGTLVVDLNAGMHADLRHADGTVPEAPRALFASGSFALPAGRYALRVRHPRRANRTDYTLRVSTRELLPGQRRRVSLPVRIPLVVPENGQLRVHSTGPADTRAFLHRERPVAEGSRHVEIARVDDNGADWNFALHGRFPPGRYELELRGSPGRSRETTVVMLAAGNDDARARGQAVAPATLELAGGRELSVEMKPGTTRTVSVPPGPGLVVARSSGTAWRLTAPGLAAVSGGNVSALAYESPPARITLSGTASRVESVRLRHVAMTAGPAVPVTGGQIALEPNRTRRFTLPPADRATGPWRRVTFELPAGVYAFVAGQTVGGVRPGRFSLDTDADGFRVANLSASIRHVGVSLSAVKSAQLRFVRASGPGRWRPLMPHPLKAAGAGVVADEDIGEISLGTGLTVAWTEHPGLWSSLPALKYAAGSVAPLAVSDAGGTVVMRDAQPRLLTVRAPLPVLLRMQDAAGSGHALISEGVKRFVVPAGKVRLDILTLLGPTDVQLSSIAATDLVEGLTAPQVLASGAMALYQFELGTGRHIGLGLSSETAALRLQLLDAAGAPLAEAANLTRRLPAGQYLVAVRNSGPVAATLRVALVGTITPDLPPDEVVQGFLRRALAQGVKP